MAEGTRGRRLQEGETEIKMFGEQVPVRCHVEHLGGLSAHADRSELLRWLGNFEQPPKQTLIVHGEPTAAEALAQTLRQDQHWPNVSVPDYLDKVVLFEGI